MNPVDAFRGAMQGAGLILCGPIIPDGRLHRFRTEGDHARNSWYAFHPDHPAAGAFGCWKRSISQTWCAGNGGLSEREIADLKRRMEQAREAQARERASLADRARKAAAWIVSRAADATADHPYMQSKGVKPVPGLRVHRGELIVPLRDDSGSLQTVEKIRGDGSKRFLTGGSTKGVWFEIPGQPDSPVIICEGIATGLSIREAVSATILCAMNCGNLLPVAQAVRQRHPTREIIVAADDDAATEGNPGMAKAEVAAKAIGARLAKPVFLIGQSGSDFNDLHRQAGIDAVREHLLGAALPEESMEETVERLASLSALEYDLQRKETAKRLGIRPATLDAEIKARRPDMQAMNKGAELGLVDLEPWPEPIDGAEILQAVADRISRYVCMSPGAVEAVALWIAHAHAFEAFIHTPRLNVCSPEKGCGKTTLLDVLASLLPRPLRTESITSAVLFRIVDQFKPVLLLDECDTYLKEAEELRGLLNAGHKRGARALRCEGDQNTVRAFNAFAPVALAGIGQLPGTLHDRSIVVRLVRARPGEIPCRFDSRRTEEETKLARQLSRWAKDNMEALEEADPELPPGAMNRLADNWRVLLAVAQVAGGGWIDTAQSAFRILVGTDDADAHGIGTTLLSDIRDIFAAKMTDRLPSQELCIAMASLEGRPWAEWGRKEHPISANQLARQLRKFKIIPGTIRLPNGSTPKGYHHDQFTEAFSRFLPNPGDQPATTPQGQ